MEAAPAPPVKTADACQPEPQAPGPRLVDCLEHAVTCPGCVWTSRGDAERPLSPSAGPSVCCTPCPSVVWKRRGGLWPPGRTGLLPVALPSCCHTSEIQPPPLGGSCCFGVTCPSKGRKPFPGVSHEPQGPCFCALSWGSLGHLRAPSLRGSPAPACLPASARGDWHSDALGHPSVPSDVCLVVWDEPPVPCRGVDDGQLNACLPRMLQVSVTETAGEKQGQDDLMSPKVRLFQVF